MTSQARRGPGRPKLYASRLGSLNLTVAQRDALEAMGRANQRCVSDEIRAAIDAAIDRYRTDVATKEAMPA